MKESIYNSYYEKGDELIIYNTITSAVLLLDEKHKQLYNDFLENKTHLDENLKTELMKGGMLLEDEYNEKQAVEFFHMEKRLRHNSLSLTIAPTSDCNFRCPYCYEKGIEHIHMDDSTIDALFEFAKKQEKKKLAVTWYGGEPTLCLDEIEKISDLFIEYYGEDNYSATMVSNGYLLNREAALKLKSKNVTNVQITIDGPKEFHDKRRIFYDGSGSFDKIIENIENIYDILKIVIRINVDKTNIKETMRLIEYLDEKGLLEKIKFYIAPVNDINASRRNHNCFSQKEFSKFEIDIYNKFQKYHPMKPPFATLGICGAISVDSYVVAPDGKLYKCWDEIGREGTEIGNVYEGITDKFNYLKWVSYNIKNYNKECDQCKNLPTCYGGCPYQNMKRQGESHCISFMHNGVDIINNLYAKNKKVD